MMARTLIPMLFMLLAPWAHGQEKQAKEAVPEGALAEHRQYIDSANHYKKIDLEKSIDFIARSMEGLGSMGNKLAFAKSLSTLGEIYSYHKQYDLAIANFKDALEAHGSHATKLALGRTYVLAGDPGSGVDTLFPLVENNRFGPDQRVELHEALGDAHIGLGDLKKALAFYHEAMRIAEKNQLSPKLIDLNAKIADAYATEDRLQEAEGYYRNSLKLSREVAPERLIRENERVADFYRQKQRFGDEIQLRKKSLEELGQRPALNGAAALRGRGADSISSQSINFKIANAYIAQDLLDEAIPYLKKSIVEADREDDLLVQKDATRKLSEVYRDKGAFVQALESYQNYVAVVDSLYLRKEQEIARAARFNRDIANTQNRISSLERERQLAQSKYSLAVTEQQLFEETSKRQQWIILSLAFGILLMALTALLYYRSHKQQKLANNLLALKSLRAQMNPHFIFNALNSVNHYIAKSDERSANRFLSAFSVLMRSVLENSEEDFIPLDKELELLELYVGLEHSRFQDKFDYQIQVDPSIDLATYWIPPMLLQPYIENAIWHGLRYKEEKGLLKIGVRPLGADLLEIVIQDNGIGRKRSAEIKTGNQKKQKSKGMGNIKKRIEILNGMYRNRIEVEVTDLDGAQRGTLVRLKLRKQ